MEEVYAGLSKAEKEEIIQLVERSELGVGKTLQQPSIHKGTFYRWYKAYLNKSEMAQSLVKPSRRQWNTIPEVQKTLVMEIAWSTRNYQPESWP